GWYSHNINNPRNALRIWRSDYNDGRWASMNFAYGRVQFSRGNLLDLGDNYYVYSQRIPLTDWMSYKTAFDDFDVPFGKNMVGNYYQDFYRYPWNIMIENRVVTTIKSADEDEIVVE
ncbi:hypothetical protein, partial [Gallibacterium genomosp. 3]